MLINFPNPLLDEGAEKPRPGWVLKVGNKTNVHEAGDSLLNALQTMKKNLFLDHQVKNHFAEKENKISPQCNF